MENISNTFYEYAASGQQMTCLSCGKKIAESCELSKVQRER